MNRTVTGAARPVSAQPGAWGWRQGLPYGLLGLPLALCALPLYVLMPHHYATNHGVPLASLGALLVLRLADAFTDPWIGRVCDRLATTGHQGLWRAMAAAGATLALAFTDLWHAPTGHADAGLSAPTLALGWAALTLTLTYLSYSLLTVAHQSWGAALGGHARGQSAVVAWREGLGLAGVVLAALLPSLFGVQALGPVMALALALALWALRSAPRPAEATGGAPPPQQPVWAELFAPWREAAFVRLVLVFALNGIASAIPASLVLFFMTDRLQLDPTVHGAFLGLYFLSAAASLQLWLHAVARWGLARAWFSGMLLAIAAFAGAALLGAGDIKAYAGVCALSGLALGSDLAIPAALLSQLRGTARSGASAGHTGVRHGVAFGWWNFVAKLNLALAAGLALPLLAWLGYEPGARDADSLQKLSAVYCLLPCLLKGLAALALHHLFIRSPHERPHAP